MWIGKRRPAVGARKSRNFLSKEKWKIWFASSLRIKSCASLSVVLSACMSLIPINSLPRGYYDEGVVDIQRWKSSEHQNESPKVESYISLLLCDASTTPTKIFEGLLRSKAILWNIQHYLHVDYRTFGEVAAHQLPRLNHPTYGLRSCHIHNVDVKNRGPCLLNGDLDRRLPSSVGMIY